MRCHERLEFVVAVIAKRPVITAAASRNAGGQSVPARKWMRRLPWLRRNSSEKAGKRGFGTTLLLRLGKRELDVLAGAELARSIIGA
jgi:hypothetical protein